jgi:hypothetical protein
MASDLRNEAGTPRHIFEVLHAEYRFDVDICASYHNHKLPDYLTEEDNSLALHWGGLRVWCNNPYRDIPAWLAHSHEPILVAYLLPVRTDRMWWQKYKPQAECHYFVGEKPHKRLQFEPPPGVEYSSNPCCECLLIFGEGATPGLEVWRSGLTGARL